LRRDIVWKEGTGGVSRSATRMKCIRFLAEGTRESESVSQWYSRRKASFLKTIDEAACGIWNELGRMQWRNSMAQRLAACYVRVMLGIWSKCCNNLGNSMLL